MKNQINKNRKGEITLGALALCSILGITSFQTYKHEKQLNQIEPVVYQNQQDVNYLGNYVASQPWSATPVSQPTQQNWRQQIQFNTTSPLAVGRSK